ncbi:heterokaryon incompatibility protein-domain-containing protein [Xylaria digitata]|nr:heterokaryon incompatibility protein-domain-containing protein [Xylaria digitata]
MWLLNSCSGEMKEFLADEQTPPYAILSHTWGEDEVSFRDWHYGPWSEVQKKQGYRKINYCCQQAIAEGLEWVWGNCCIDKSSSSELSEAINSMFQWYANAIVCYVYLIDVAYIQNATEEEVKLSLANSRWVSRGWTLQELIAPHHVVFYSKDWQNCGTRSKLSTTLEAITRIDESYLNGRPLDDASVAQRMSWASRRTTSRKEDQAYCLLGIFNVNMPLIYGEKSKAFRRLQEAIYREYPEDHSLYAWGQVVNEFSYEIKDEDQIWVDQKLFGLFAESPADFMNSGQIVPAPLANRYFQSKNVLHSPTSSIGRTTQVYFPTSYGGYHAVHLQTPPIGADFLTLTPSLAFMSRP